MSLTLTELVDSIESGRLTSLELIESCLSWIDISDPELHAWVMIDRDGAVTRARESDARRSENRPLSRLDGIPVGVKDIIDVAGWPTVAGFKPWSDKIATTDAWIVANPQRAPTERGLPRFMRSWFDRSVEIGRRRYAQGPARKSGASSIHAV